MELKQRSSIATCIALVLFASASVARAELSWLDDLEKAKVVAAEQHKDLFINFTGTSWCEHCMELERETLSTDAFAPAADTFVLVKLEYPGSVPRLPQEAPAPHPTWLDTYGVVAYPTIFLADANGVPYATTGQLDIKPADFVQHLLKLQKTHKIRDEAFANATNAAGLDRAKQLDIGLKTLQAAFEDTVDYTNADPLLKFYGKEVDAVVQADPDNTSGLGGHWQKIQQRERDLADGKAFQLQLSETFKKDGIDAALGLISEKSNTVSKERQKELCWTRIYYLENAQHYSEAIDYANQLLADTRFDADQRISLRRRIATNLRWLDRNDESAAAYDEILADVTDPARKAHILSDKADVYWYAKRYQEALDTHDAAIKLIDKNTVQWDDEQAWRIRLLARLGRAKDAWAAYDEFANSKTCFEQARLNLMAIIAMLLEEGGAHGDAREAALRTKQRVESEKDATVDLSEAREIIDKILSPVPAKTSDSMPDSKKP